MQARQKATIAASCAVVALLAVSCSDDPASPKEFTSPGAEAMALWLSGELRAPDHLSRTIAMQLWMIRNTYGDSIPQVQIGFHPPWVPGMILLKLTEEGKDLLRRGEFEEFDSLNARYGLAEMDTTRLERFGSLSLTFEDPLHPGRLSASYGPIPEVVYAHPNHIIGDGSIVYPWGSGLRLTYLFREAWGDCPSGCIHSRFWYFRCVGSECTFVGYWDRSSPEPEWWEEAEIAVKEYHQIG